MTSGSQTCGLAEAGGQQREDGEGEHEGEPGHGASLSRTVNARHVAIPPLPAPLTWDVEPASWSLDPLTIAAPAALRPLPRPGRRRAGDRRAAPARPGRRRLPALRARALRVRGHLRRGGAAAVGGRGRVGEARLRGVAAGRGGVVSVVTHALSDDANAFAVAGDAVWLRISRLGPAVALHARLDDEPWRFVRHFAFAAPGGVRAGFLAQSPLGDGATARFDEIGFTARAPRGSALGRLIRLAGLDPLRAVERELVGLRAPLGEHRLEQERVVVAGVDALEHAADEAVRAARRAAACRPARPATRSARTCRPRRRSRRRTARRARPAPRGRSAPRAARRRGRRGRCGSCARGRRGSATGRCSPGWRSRRGSRRARRPRTR